MQRPATPKTLGVFGGAQVENGRGGLFTDSSSLAVRGRSQPGDLQAQKNLIKKFLRLPGNLGGAGLRAPPWGSFGEATVG